MALFFHSHACNQICESMGLTPFNLSPREQDTVNQNTKLLVGVWCGPAGALPCFCVSTGLKDLSPIHAPPPHPKFVHRAFPSAPLIPGVPGVCLTGAHSAQSEETRCVEKGREVCGVCVSTNGWTRPGPVSTGTSLCPGHAPPHHHHTHMDQTSENVGKDQLGILTMHSPARGGECGRHFGEGWPDGPSRSYSRWPFSEACGLIPTDYF